MPHRSVANPPPAAVDVLPGAASSSPAPGAPRSAPSRAGPSRAGPSRAEPSRAGASGAGTGAAGRRRGGAGRAARECGADGTGSVSARAPRAFRGLWALRSGARFAGVQHFGEANGRRAFVVLTSVHVGQARVSGRTYLERAAGAGWMGVNWVGEIIDNRHHTFKTDKWNAGFSDDVDYWSSFFGFSKITDGFAKGLFAHVELHEIDLSDMNCVFMRWKEADFDENGPEPGYTTDGFYYACMDRKSGEIRALYLDKINRVWRNLDVKPIVIDIAGQNASR